MAQTTADVTDSLVAEKYGPYPENKLQAPPTNPSHVGDLPKR